MRQEVVEAFSFNFDQCHLPDYSDPSVPGVGPPITLRAIGRCRHGVMHRDVDLLFVVHQPSFPLADLWKSYRGDVSDLLPLAWLWSLS